MIDKALLNSQLQKYFGFDRFKGQQEAVITIILEIHDTFVLMPTGVVQSSTY